MSLPRDRARWCRGIAGDRARRREPRLPPHRTDRSVAGPNAVSQYGITGYVPITAFPAALPPDMQQSLRSTRRGGWETVPDPVLMVSFSRLRGGSADRAKEQVLNVGARSADKHCEARAVAQMILTKASYQVKPTQDSLHRAATPTSLRMRGLCVVCHQGNDQRSDIICGSCRSRLGESWSLAREAPKIVPDSQSCDAHLEGGNICPGRPFIHGMCLYHSKQGQPKPVTA